MDVRELGQVLRAAPQEDAPQVPFEVDWLAQALAGLENVAGVRVFVARAGTGEAYQADMPVCAAATLGAAPNAATLGELRLFGKQAVLGDRRPITHEILAGPHESDAALTAERVCLTVRVWTQTALAWFQIYAGKESSRLKDPKAWCDGLYAVVEQTIPAVDAPIGARRRFLADIASYQPHCPERDFKAVCRAWRTVLRAEAAGLWLSDRNDQERTYELAAWDSEACRPERRVATGMELRGKEMVAAAGHFACRHWQGPLWISDVRTWSQERVEQIGDETLKVVYEVRLRDILAEMGCHTLLLVPLRAVENHGEYASLMSLHYKDEQHRHLHDHQILDVMGRLTAKMIALSQEHEQHEILKQLNRIAGRYLGEPGRLSAMLPSYVKEVIDVIKAHLRVELASVFYKSRFDEAIECIGTTGICDVVTGQKISSDALARSRYELKDATPMPNTVRCFMEHKAIVVRNGEEDPDRLFSERIASESRRPPFDPSVYVPIPDPLAPEQPRSIGVVRCYGHKSAVFQNEYANFDHVDLSTLRFIAEQVAPILKIFEYRMLKEQAVIRTKHDLYFPTRMGRDATDSLIQDFEGSRPIRAVDLSDLRTTLGVIQNMIGELDPEPEKLPQLTRRTTKLEGDIVARLKDMLQPLAEERGIDIRFDGLREIPPLELDREQIERALFNLIINGIKYGRKNSEIWIRGALRDDPPFYEIDVCNEGDGIPESIKAEDLFLPGYRTPEAQRAAMGQGLGLTIARAAIRAHGGELILARRRDPIIFRVQLPRRKRGA